jgi:hypothetical protein
MGRECASSTSYEVSLNNNTPLNMSLDTSLMFRSNIVENGLPGPTATMENTAWDSGFLDDISWDWGDLNSITGHAIG